MAPTARSRPPTIRQTATSALWWKRRNTDDVTLRTFFDLGQPVAVAYVHSARSPADILFRHELDWMSSIAGKRPAMTVTHICERSAKDEH